jgi:regulator of protease activity HflC (stomatin/prohibitin superfamily)
VDPGLWKVNVLTEEMRQVDIKVQIETIPQQWVVTKDNVHVGIDSVIYWEIIDPYTVAFLVSDVRKAVVERTQTTLRHIFGTRTLQDCIENRDTIAHEIQDLIEEPTRSWGVSIESILIKDIQFSKELQETLSAAG